MFKKNNLSNLFHWFRTTYSLQVQEHLQQCSVCESAKIFLTSKISYLLFSNPTHETKTGTADRGETTNTKPPGPIRNRDQQPQHIYYTLLWQLLLGFAGPFTSLSKLCKNSGSKPFCWAKLSCFDFSSSNFNFAGSHTEHRWSCSKQWK